MPAASRRDEGCAPLIYLFFSLDFYLHVHWHVSGMERNGEKGCGDWDWGKAIAASCRRLLPLFVKVLRAPFRGQGKVPNWPNGVNANTSRD